MMDTINSKDGYFEADIEKGIVNDNLCSGKDVIFGIVRMNQPFSEPIDSGLGDSDKAKLLVVERGGDGLEKKMVREKPKAMSAKKPPKPPRPPRGGMSLDLADQKLIRELHELAKLKRARIDRMKKRAKEAKVASSRNYQFATLLTVLFCVVFLFQGISSRTNSAVNFNASLVSSLATEDSVVSVQRYPTSSASNLNGPSSKSSRLAEPGLGSDTPEHVSTEVG